MAESYALLEACYRCGIQLSRERAVIIQALAESTDHPTAEQLHARARNTLPTLSRPTVYRTLALLLRYDLAFKFDFRNGASRYEDATIGAHHHLIDANAGTIIDFSDPDFEKAIGPIMTARGLDLPGHRFEIIYVDAAPTLASWRRRTIPRRVRRR